MLRLADPLWTMIPMDQEPAEIHREYLEVLKQKGVDAAVTLVED